jgi:hypothetical protein
MNDKQYPLAWPPGWKRTDRPTSSKFGNVSISAESYEIFRQLRLMGASNIIISSNMRYRADGLPYANQGYIEDTGIAVYFDLNGDQQCIPCDKWNNIGDNLRAVSKTIDALRGIERWGAKEMVNAAFRGFKALPASFEMPAGRIHRDWWTVLGVDRYANVLEVKSAYREAIKLHHPDAGGKEEDLKEIRQAYEEWKDV